MSWNLSCPDWAAKLKSGRTPVREDLPLDLVEGNRAVAVYNKLRLADVPGTPTLAEASGDWFRDIVRVLFGSLDAVTRQRMIRELFLLVPKKNSKALALDTLIATPAGFTTMGAVQIGDAVLDVAGRPTTVIGKSEVFTGRKCFEVEFSTGERVICDEQHLWVTDAHADRDRQPRAQRSRPMPTVKTTGEIATTVKIKSGNLQISNHRTALCGALELPEAALPIPPYVLGAWLGDGATDAAVITAGADEVEHIVGQIRAAGHSAEVKGFDKRSSAARISIAEPGDRNDRTKYRFRSAAIRLGVLGNKHIPAMYLRASQGQRLELLRGLMDTDGSISKAGQATYVTTLPALRDDVLELVNSLGIKASCSEHRATLNGVDCGPVWNIQFWPFDSIPVFTLPRKLERQRPSAARNSARSRTRQIVTVREVDSVPTQCIMVASDTHQFLITRSLVPTHNTTNGALLMLTALLLNERPKAPYIMTAPVQDVADLAFSAVAGAIRLDPVLEKKLHVREHLKTIVHRETQATLEIMTFDPSVLTGQKVVGALIDELHVCAKMSKAASAIRQLRGGMLPFPEAFLAFITTQSEEQPAGVFKAELDKARAIRDGEREGAMLPVLYEFPVEMQKDREQWENPANWPMVTPNAGRSISIERLIEEKAAAQATSEQELRAWASQHLDIEIGIALAGAGWAGALFWEANAEESLTLEELIERSEVLCIGIDGGGLDDLLGLAVMGRDAVTKQWLHWGRGYAQPTVFERRKEIAPRLMDFMDQGDLILVEPGQDVVLVGDVIEQCEDSGLLDKIGVDVAGIGAVVDEIVGRKIEQNRIIAVPQGWRMVNAIKTSERKLAEKALRHGGQPIMAWCVGNAKPEPRGNAVIITKAVAGTAKIDLLMATFNAVSLMSDNPKPRKRKHQIFFI